MHAVLQLLLTKNILATLCWLHCHQRCFDGQGCRVSSRQTSHWWHHRQIRLELDRRANLVYQEVVRLVSQTHFEVSDFLARDQRYVCLMVSIKINAHSRRYCNYAPWLLDSCGVSAVSAIVPAVVACRLSRVTFQLR